MTSRTGLALDQLADAAVELAELRHAAQTVLSRAWSPAAYLRLLDSSDPAFDPPLWTTILSLGWADVLVDEGKGGGGGGMRQLCILAEAAGWATAPIPLGAAAAAAWTENACVDSLTLVLPGASVLSRRGAVGSWPVVPFGGVASRLLTLSSDAAGSVLGVVEVSGAGVERERLIQLDRNPAVTLSLQDAPLEVIARGPDAIERHRGALLRTQLATIAELVGIAAAASEAAVQYANVRVAFGRRIGSFQAIKHRLVDQRSVIEVSRALVNRAADAIDSDSPDAEPLVSLASFWALSKLRAVPEGALQVFGGIGFTWEHEAHAHLRRAARASASLGKRAQHRSVVAAWLESRY